VSDAGRIAAATLVIGGVVYLIFQASSANAAQPGPGALLYPAQNGPPGRLDPNQVLAIINQVNDSMGDPLDPLDVLTFCKIESNFDPAAYRYEASLNDASMGLMQLLSSTARQMGYSGDPSGLYDPTTNIQLGMAYLVWLQNYLAGQLGTYTHDQWVAAYNEGPGNAVKGYADLPYVQRFNLARAQIGAAVTS
jgi:soluble lytic murein transglycosylase-like protein